MTNPDDTLSFSAMYLRSDKPLPDSKRFRIRLGGIFQDHRIGEISGAAQLLRSAGGIEVPYSGFGYLYSDFFKTAALRDVLDSIGIIYDGLRAKGQTIVAEQWKARVAEALKSETLAYRITDRCTVRYLVDEEFERNNAATLAHLQSPKLVNARRFFEEAVGALEQTPPDTRMALREIYEACEEAYKIVLGLPAGARLTTRNASDVFKPPTTPQAVATAVKEMGDGFSAWVTACQQYRHAAGDPTPEAAEPPLALAILMFSQGAGYLRWIAGLVS